MKITVTQLKKLIHEQVEEAKQDMYADERKKIKKTVTPNPTSSSSGSDMDHENKQNVETEARAALGLWKKYAPDFTTPNGTVVKDISKIRNFLPKTWDSGQAISDDQRQVDWITKRLADLAKAYNEQLSKKNQPKPETSPAKPTGMFNRVRGALGLNEMRQMVKEEVARQLRNKR
jgi:hypothetical protein